MGKRLQEGWDKSPEWFDLKDYDYLKNLGIGGWAHVISTIAFDRTTLFPPQGLREEEIKPDRYSLLHWEEQRRKRCELALFNDLSKEEQEAYRKANFGQPFNGEFDRIVRNEPVYRITPSRAKSDLGYRSGGHQLVMIDLFTPDEILIDAFHRLLQEERSRIPLEVKQRGPKGKNTTGKFSQEHFARWTKMKIVEYADLLFWASCEGFRLSATHAEVLLFPHQDQAAKETKKELKKAIADVFPLVAQARYEMILGKK